MASSLGRRLGLGFAAIGIAAALLSALLVNLAFSNRFDTYVEQQRAAQVQQLAAAVTTVYRSAGRWDTARLDQLASAVAMTGAQVALRDATGRLVWPADGSATADMTAMHRSMTSPRPLGAPVDVPITVDGQQRGTLRVALPDGDVPAADQQFRSAVNRLLFAGAGGVAVLASVLGLLLARRVTRPVAELTAAVRDLRAGHRGRRAAVTGADEVIGLARAFNDLAESAEREEALRRSFAADVAHELRTPLAILRGQLEAVQDGVVAPTADVIGSLHAETLRLGRLVADLETLTSAEAVSFSLHRQPVDLADVVRSACTSLDHRRREAGLTFSIRLTPAPVCGDRTRLAQVVGNLLTNALKFVPPGGQVELGTQRAGDRVVLTVRDDGPGIPDDELPHVFERYFRGARARAGGSGIGLAVVAALVHAHGGTVTAANGPAGGAVFTVVLPVGDTSHDSAAAGVRPAPAERNAHVGTG